jgi:hypothetical protein
VITERHICPKCGEKLHTHYCSLEMIRADDLDELASQPKYHGGPDIPEALTRAAATIRALTERAEKAESKRDDLYNAYVVTSEEGSEIAGCLQQERDAARAELAALRATDNRRAEIVIEVKAAHDKLLAETADLREIERCKRSIEAAGCDWCDNASGEIFVFDCIGDEDDLNMRCATWPEAERAAWEHYSADARAEIEAVGYHLLLQFGEPCDAPVVAQLAPHTGPVQYITGDLGSYPTRGDISAAVEWARKHPANSSEIPNGCTCGHEHDGCKGCRHIKLAWDASPCVDCMYGQDGPQECQYDPAPLMCKHCGNPYDASLNE